METGPMEFEFAVDPETTKLVHISRLGRRLDIRVRIARDVVLEEHQHRLAVDEEPVVQRDTLGVQIAYVTAHLFGLIRWERTARF